MKEHTKILFIPIPILAVLLGAIMIASLTCNSPPPQNPSPPQNTNQVDLSWAETWKGEAAYQAMVKSTAGTAVSSAAELKEIKAGKEYHLTQDIDLGETKWTALHSTAAPFTGTLHGNGYIVYNLEIETRENYQGLFAALQGATIENLGIGIRKIVAGAVIGALAGMAKDSVLSNIAVAPVDASAQIAQITSLTLYAQTSGISIDDTAPGYFVGGVVGYLASSATDAKSSIQAFNLGGKIQNVGRHTGGLVGYNGGGAVTGYATGAVSGVGRVGGLVGHNVKGTVTGYTTGAISGTEPSIGGLAGYNGVGTVTGYATGAVSGKTQVGGLVGDNTEGTVTGYATGAISGTENSIGGLVGWSNGTVTGYATGAISGASHTGGLVGLNYRTAVGYARGTVTRKSGSTNTDFGAVTGNRANTVSVSGTVTTTGYHSGKSGESHVLMQDKQPLTGATGANGTEIIVNTDTTQTAFDALAFKDAAEANPWVWVENGKWPAIDIGDIGGNSNLSKQPIAP